jgi:hypothetical protein
MNNNSEPIDTTDRNQKRRPTLRRRLLWVLATTLFLTLMIVLAVLKALHSMEKTLFVEKRAYTEYAQVSYAVHQIGNGSIFQRSDGTYIRFAMSDAKGPYEALVIEMPRMTVKRLRSRTWFNQNHALLVGLDTERSFGSYTELEEYWLLYDFKKNMLMSCESLQESCEALKSKAGNLQ